MNDEKKEGSVVEQGQLTSLIEPIAQIIEQARGEVRYAVNQAMVQSYWQIGKVIVEQEQQGKERAEYGTQQLKQLSNALTERLGKGFDVTNLRNMRRFYLVFPIRDAVRPELSWTHYRTLIRVDNTNAREWYLKEAVSQNWSARALERQISKLYYERLLANKNKALVEQEAKTQTEPLAESVHDYLRDPYILDFLNLQDKTYQESELEQAIISNIQQFLLELGKGFAFVERQQRIRFDDEDFYIDLVFYNFKLKCFLLVDLKLGKLKHQDVGQMDTYVRLYDEQHKDDDDNPTIGLVLCSEKSEAVVKYSVLAVDILPALKDGDSYGAQARHGAASESLRWVPAAGGLTAPLTSQANWACPALKIFIAPTTSAFSLKSHATHSNCACDLRLSA